MLIKRIEGFTRLLGKSQGYLGLPVRDEVIVDAATDDETPSMTTAWEPTPEELDALNAGASVQVRLLGDVHPPIMVFTGPVPDQH